MARWRSEGSYTASLGPFSLGGKRIVIQGANVYRVANGRLAKGVDTIEQLLSGV